MQNIFSLSTGSCKTLLGYFHHLCGLNKVISQPGVTRSKLAIETEQRYWSHYC